MLSNCTPVEKFCGCAKPIDGIMSTSRNASVSFGVTSVSRDWSAHPFSLLFEKKEESESGTETVAQDR